jgi:OOP family OmpA-OmpF porin
VVGYTDNRGDPDYNVWLSEKRAETVRDYLAEVSPEAKNIRVEGKGRMNPVASNNTKEGRAANRRVSIIFVDD